MQLESSPHVAQASLFLPRPQTNPYYEATTNGLDTLLHTMYDNAIRLTQDLPTDLSLNNGHFAFMWACGPADFYGGLTKMTKLYVDDNSTPYNTIEVMEIILLAIIVILCIGYVVRRGEDLEGRSDFDAFLLFLMFLELGVALLLYGITFYTHYKYNSISKILATHT